MLPSTFDLRPATCGEYMIAVVVGVALDRGIAVDGICAGYEGLLRGGEMIRPLPATRTGHLIVH